MKKIITHSDSHSPISTASDQLAWQFHFWLWVSWGKNTVVYNIFWICGTHAKSTLASFQADEYHTYLINLGNDDDVPGAPACFAVILLALVTLSKGIDFILYWSYLHGDKQWRFSIYVTVVYGISSQGQWMLNIVYGIYSAVQDNLSRSACGCWRNT